MIPDYPLLLAAACTAFALAAQHYILHNVLQRPPAAPISYIMGTATLWVGFALWAWLTGNEQAAAALAIIIGMSGAVVLAMYLFESAATAKGLAEELAAVRELARRKAEAHDPRA